MASIRVQEIERAIGELNEQELAELRVWFDEFVGSQPIDMRILQDLTAGRLDKTAERAIEDEKRKRVKSL